MIGNAEYQSSSLSSPINDATDMAAALRAAGFNVRLITKADQPTMEQSINEFGRELRTSEVGLFYYSGHGVQYEGSNYLLPIGSMPFISTPDQLRYKSVNAGYLLSVMRDAGNKLNLVILDACRDNPFKGFSKGLQNGLVRMPGAEGMLIAYATAPGNVAFDGQERNSPYTKHLLKFMKTPNLQIEILLKKVRTAVKQETKGKQAPWYEASIDGDFYFNSQASQADEVRELLNACEQHFQDNRLTSGRGGTALECYERVLTLDPDNAEALNGLQEIEAKYVEWIDKALQRGQKNKARQYLASLRSVNPESPALNELEMLLAEPTPTLPSTATPIIPPTPSMSTATPKTRISLRSVPTTVSWDEGRKEFGLDKGWRPLKYIENDFEDRGDVVLDRATGLMWQKSGSRVVMKYREAQAQAYVKELNRQAFAGYTDWRLPTLPELLSLLEAEESSNGLYINPFFDSAQTWCWSADVGSAGSAWGVTFAYGGVGLDRFGRTGYVRCVRS